MGSTHLLELFPGKQANAPAALGMVPEAPGAAPTALGRQLKHPQHSTALHMLDNHVGSSFCPSQISTTS
jgi:hypothetical protein